METKKISKSLLQYYLDNYDVQNIVVDNESVREFSDSSEIIWQSTSPFIYTLLEDGTYAIKAANANLSGAIFIPGTFNNRPITQIDDAAFRYRTSLTNITIPDSVTRIGTSAFDYCTSLTNVTIGNSVHTIGEKAFCHCNSLTSITIPDNVTAILDSAFWECYGLTSISIGNGVTSIGNRAFSDCTSLTSIRIPNSVTRIGNSAFSGCTSLKSITSYDIWSFGGKVVNISSDRVTAFTSTYLNYQWIKYSIKPPVVTAALATDSTGLELYVYNPNPVTLTPTGRAEYILNQNGTKYTDNINDSLKKTTVDSYSSSTLFTGAMDIDLTGITFVSATVQLYFEEDSSLKSTLKAYKDGSVIVDHILPPSSTSVCQDTPESFECSLYNPNDVDLDYYVILFDYYGTAVGSGKGHAGAKASDVLYIDITSSAEVLEYEMYFDIGNNNRSESTLGQPS